MSASDLYPVRQIEVSGDVNRIDSHSLCNVLYKPVGLESMMVIKRDGRGTKVLTWLLLLRIITTGPYNPPVRIIDLVSHTTYAVCINFLHLWWHLQFKVNSDQQIFFWEAFYGNLIYTHDVVFSTRKMCILLKKKIFVFVS